MSSDSSSSDDDYDIENDGGGEYKVADDGEFNGFNQNDEPAQLGTRLLGKSMLDISISLSLRSH